jgi:hypothetical protein
MRAESSSSGNAHARQSKGQLFLICSPIMGGSGWMHLPYAQNCCFYIRSSVGLSLSLAQLRLGMKPSSEGVLEPIKANASKPFVFAMWAA